MLTPLPPSIYREVSSCETFAASHSNSVMYSQDIAKRHLAVGLPKRWSALATAEELREPMGDLHSSIVCSGGEH